MLKKIIKSIVKFGLVVLNRVSCKTYKRLYPKYLSWIGVRIEDDYQQGGFDPWISPSAYFDPGYPELISVGSGTTISFDACFLAHDYSVDKELYAQYKERGLFLGKINIGRNCFIGARAMILLGTTLGDGCIVGANAVVKGHFPAGSIIVGNPGRVIGNAETLLAKHKEKGDISYWRGDNYDTFEMVLPPDPEPKK